MDPWNPILSQQYVRRVPAWQVYAFELVAVFAAAFIGWVLLAIYFGVTP